LGSPSLTEQGTDKYLADPAIPIRQRNIPLVPNRFAQNPVIV